MSIKSMIRGIGLLIGILVMLVGLMTPLPAFILLGLGSLVVILSVVFTLGDR